MWWDSGANLVGTASTALHWIVKPVLLSRRICLYEDLGALPQTTQVDAIDASVIASFLLIRHFSTRVLKIADSAPFTFPSGNAMVIGWATLPPEKRKATHLCFAETSVGALVTVTPFFARAHFFAMLASFLSALSVNSGIGSVSKLWFIVPGASRTKGLESFLFTTVAFTTLPSWIFLPREGSLKIWIPFLSTTLYKTPSL